MWANINPPGGYNKPHLHPNSHFSGVYYIKAPKNSGQIVFNEPRATAHMVMPRRKEGKPLKKVSTKPFSTKGFRLLWPYRHGEQWQYNTKSNHNLLNYLQQKI